MFNQVGICHLMEWLTSNTHQFNNKKHKKFKAELGS